MKNFKILLISIISLLTLSSVLLVGAYIADYKNNQNVIQEKKLKDEFLNVEIDEISQNYFNNSFYLKFKNAVLDGDKQYRMKLKFNDDEKIIEEEYDDKTLIRTSKYNSFNPNSISIVSRNVKMPDKITKFSYQILIVDVSQQKNENPVKPIVLKESNWSTIIPCEYPSKFKEYTSPTKDKYNEKLILNSVINNLDEGQKKEMEDNKKLLEKKRIEFEDFQKQIDTLKSKNDIKDVEKSQLKSLVEKQSKLKIEINDLSNLLGEKRAEKRGSLC